MQSLVKLYVSFKVMLFFYKIYPIYTTGDTKQSTPISAQITALRLKPERISFCDRFTDIKRKPTFEQPVKQTVQITNREVCGMPKRIWINHQIHINRFFYQMFCQNVIVFLKPILFSFFGCYLS